MSDVPARALFHTAPRCVEIRELPTPRPAAGEVLVRTLSSGISGGTERLVYRGEVVFAGSVAELQAEPRSLTGQALKEKK